MPIRKKYSDLRPRIVSSIVLLCVIGSAFFTGGSVFLALFIGLTAVMMLELSWLTGVKLSRSYVMAVLYAGAIFILFHIDFILGIVALSVAVLVFFRYANVHYRIVGLITIVIISMSLLAFYTLRIDEEMITILWIVACVIASDIAGYFVGRAIGGPKLLPKISPKKTWSGTIGGWVCACFITIAFAIYGVEISFIDYFFAILIAFSAQMGDIGESWLKRQANVKDSSQLIPGHGGFLDRMDGMLGAFFLVSMITLCNYQDILLK